MTLLRHRRACAPSPTGYAALVLAEPSLLAYYRLQETSGTVAKDASAKAGNGTVIGALTLGKSGPLQHEPSGAMSGFTASQYVQMATGLVLDFSKSLAVEMWYKLPDTSQNNSAFSIGNPGGNDTLRCQAHLTYAGTAYWDTGLWNTQGRESITYPTGSLGAWAHLVLTANVATAKQAIWINGTKRVEGTYGANTAQTLSGGTIGIWPNAIGVGPTNADIAEFAVYQAVPADANILARYNKAING